MRKRDREERRVLDLARRGAGRVQRAAGALLGISELECNFFFQRESESEEGKIRVRWG